MAVSLGAVLGMLALLAFSDAAMEGALNAAQSFAQGVMPALAPMMILGRLLPAGRADESAGAALRIRTVLFAWAAGSPAAAQRVLMTPLPPKRLECMLCLTGVMSPMFFTGTLAKWLQSTADGRKLLIIHWTGAAVAAALWAWLVPPAKETQPSVNIPRGAPVELASAIGQSMQPLLCVMGAMVLFSALAGVGIRAASCVFPVWMKQHTRLPALLWGVLEIGGGAAAVCREWAKPHAALSALCGFGGISLLIQNMLFLQGVVPARRLAAMRALHGAVSCALAVIAFA